MPASCTGSAITDFKTLAANGILGVGVYLQDCGAPVPSRRRGGDEPGPVLRVQLGPVLQATSLGSPRAAGCASRGRVSRRQQRHHHPVAQHLRQRRALGAGRADLRDRNADQQRTWQRHRACARRDGLREYDLSRGAARRTPATSTAARTVCFSSTPRRRISTCTGVSQLLLLPDLDDLLERDPVVDQRGQRHINFSVANASTLSNARPTPSAIWRDPCLDFPRMTLGAWLRLGIALLLRPHGLHRHRSPEHARWRRPVLRVLIVERSLLRVLGNRAFERDQGACLRVEAGAHP
jgi:hypothetical protein